MLCGLVENRVVSIAREDYDIIKVAVEEIADEFMAWKCKYYLAWVEYFTVNDVKRRPEIIADFIRKTEKEPPDVAFPLDNKIPGYEPETDNVRIENGEYKIFAKKITLSELLGMLKTLY